MHVLPDCGQQEMRRGESHWWRFSVLTTHTNKAFVTGLDVLTKKPPLLHVNHCEWRSELSLLEFFVSTLPTGALNKKCGCLDS